MGIVITPRAASYPQTGYNRTRADLVKDILVKVGGEGSDIMQERAARALNAAIRFFNSVAWKFNRVTDDIYLDTGVGMKPNASAPSLSRDTGTATGFTLDNGKSITYWIEERVKSGSRVIKRNDAASKTVTLSGDGTNDKPVLTKPASVNPDCTHWALYGTATNGVYPAGYEIAEAAISVSAIEDTRTGNNPGIPVGATSANLYQSGFYDLSSDFRNPKHAALLDGDGKERVDIKYVPWEVYASGLSRQTTSTIPSIYTALNVFRTGKVTLHPRIASTALLTYAYLRVAYNTRIPLLAGDTDVLSVPPEVEEAILTRAAYVMFGSYKSMQDAALLKQDAIELFNYVASIYEDFEDF